MRSSTGAAQDVDAALASIVTAHKVAPAVRNCDSAGDNRTPVTRRSGATLELCARDALFHQAYAKKSFNVFAKSAVYINGHGVPSNPDVQHTTFEGH